MPENEIFLFPIANAKERSFFAKLPVGLIVILILPIIAILSIGSEIALLILFLGLLVIILLFSINIFLPKSRLEYEKSNEKFIFFSASEIKITKPDSVLIFPIKDISNLGFYYFDLTQISELSQIVWTFQCKKYVTSKK